MHCQAEVRLNLIGKWILFLNILSDQMFKKFFFGFFDEFPIKF